MGEFEAASATLARFAALRDAIKNEPPSSVAPVMVDGLAKYGESAMALRRDELESAQRVATEAVKELQATKVEPGFEALQKNVTLYSTANILGHAEYRLGHYAAAEAAQRLAIEARHKFQDQAVTDKRDIAEKSTWLAMALIKQDKIAEAAEVINPVVKFHRELAARNHGDQFEPTELAAALYAQALTNQGHRVALLQEATQLIDSVAIEVRNQHDVRQMRERIQQALQG
jgi:tetratricopeptide (TPR) repeat protein